MTAANRTPTTRILTLAAIILAAGVLSFRALDLFASPAPAPTGSAIEQKVTSFLEPMVGKDAVRVSITGKDKRRTLLLIDGPENGSTEQLQTDIEALLKASIGFNAERDQLTIKQIPFAAGTGTSLTPLQMAEFSGLGILCITLLALLMMQSRQVITTPEPARQRLEPEAKLQTAPRLQTAPEISNAARLAEQNPEQTVHILRKWMSETEDAA